MNTVHVLDATTGEYVDTGRPAQTHPFDPAATEDLCLHRLPEGDICQAAGDAPVHQG